MLTRKEVITRINQSISTEETSNPRRELMESILYYMGDGKMTNYEKYKDEIKNSIGLCELAKFLNGKLSDDCLDNTEVYKIIEIFMWLMDEYKEPEKPQFKVGDVWVGDDNVPYVILENEDANNMECAWFNDKNEFYVNNLFKDELEDDTFLYHSCDIKESFQFLINYKGNKNDYM